MFKEFTSFRNENKVIINVSSVKYVFSDENGVVTLDFGDDYITISADYKEIRDWLLSLNKEDKT